ncbi:MAG: glc operon protein GlcG [Flavobacteriales bacterium]
MTVFLMGKLFMYKKLLLSAALLVMTASSYADGARTNLNIAMAQTIVDGCLKYATTNSLTNIAISIFDDHGNLKLFYRLDGAAVGAANAAQWKARSAAIYRTTTIDTASWNVPSTPDIAVIPGGVPIVTKSGDPIGAIGVAGASPEQDVNCSNAGIKAAGLF